MSGGLVDELHEVSLEKENQDLKEILEMALQVTAQLDVENIIKNVALSLVSRFQPEAVAFVVREDVDENAIDVYSYRGTKKEEVAPDLSALLPLFAFLNKDEYAQISFSFLKDSFPDKEILEKLSGLAVDLIAPLRTDKGVFGILLLPKSGTGQPYGLLEIQYITRVIRFAAIAIENSTLFRQATTDRMTGLYSHHFFEKMLEEEMERGRRYKSTFSLVMFDIDHFKDFNDSYGHLQGDCIIKEVARLLTRSIRQVDLPARYGGEEFAVILPEVDAKGAVVVAERLRKVIGGFAFPSDAEPLHVTISVGVTQFDPEADYAPSEIVRSADKALYQSKERGRNRVSVFSDR